MAENREITKEYSNADLTVYWKPNTCIHAKKCWKGLLQVFNPQNRPWVNMEGATTKRIMKQIDECPSGALSYTMKNEAAQEDAKETEVKCMENGPLMVMGDVHITNSDGTIEKRTKVTAFCRCGASTNKPFCDGKHNDVNFVG
ncbi:(4Fe-4S)-binding protein [uncultured Tenacibaculum sp.]|uniref:(4Fe-4S)-binding protein n=1 Tax=uncultured Tenacibaculum sp. TaxID=174713 RepID=UPI00260D8563|nr:(4Fe-4S)-binding protein [uncultured Tenacibaculum sp.]